MHFASGLRRCSQPGELALLPLLAGPTLLILLDRKESAQLAVLSIDIERALFSPEIVINIGPHGGDPSSGRPFDIVSASEFQQ
jgi:hypothetical protein